MLCWKPSSSLDSEKCINTSSSIKLTELDPATPYDFVVDFYNKLTEKMFNRTWREYTRKELAFFSVFTCTIFSITAGSLKLMNLEAAGPEKTIQETYEEEEIERERHSQRQTDSQAETKTDRQII